MANHLPDPKWIETLPNCPGCGYNLTGLILPGNCPECGFGVDDKTMILSGVVKTDATQPLARRVLWIMVFVFGIILVYAWPAVFLLPWLALGLLVLWLGTFIGLLATSKRSRSGSMKVVVASGGFYVLENLNSPQHEGQAVPWDAVDRMQFDRVSPVWYKLQLWSPTNKLLEAGVRCPDKSAPLVQDTVRWRLKQTYSNSTASTHSGPSGVS